MVMPNEAYREFGDIWFKEFGERLSSTETKLKADKLMELFRKVIYTKIGDK